MENGIVFEKELLEKIAELKAQRLQMRLLFWQGKTVNTAAFKKIKKEVARLRFQQRKMEF